MNSFTSANFPRFLRHCKCKERSVRRHANKAAHRTSSQGAIRARGLVASFPYLSTSGEAPILTVFHNPCTLLWVRLPSDTGKPKYCFLRVYPVNCCIPVAAIPVNLLLAIAIAASGTLTFALLEPLRFLGIRTGMRHSMTSIRCLLLILLLVLFLLALPLLFLLLLPAFSVLLVILVLCERQSTA